MSRRKILWLAAGVLLLASGVLSYCIYMRDEARIYRMVEKLADCGSRTAEEGVVSWGMKSSQLEKLFAPDGEISISTAEYSENLSPAELCGSMAAYFNAFRHVTVRAGNIRIAVNDDTASARFSGTFSGTGGENAGRAWQIAMTGEGEALLVKQGRSWKIISLKIESE